MNENRGQYTSTPLGNIKKRPIRPVVSQETMVSTVASQKGGRRFFALSLIVCVVLPLLFLAALIVQEPMVRWAFLGVTAVCVALMWVLHAFAKSARSTLSVIYAAMAVVVGLALFMNGQAPESRYVSNPGRQDAAAAFTNNDPSALGAALSSYTTPEPQENSNAAAASATVSAVQQQLEGFLSAWAVGNIPQMLEYVLPSWKTQQTSPESALWNLTLDSRPVEFVIENIQGSDGDTTRTIVTRITLNERNTGSIPVMKRMHVIMFRSGKTWYVDPQSLNGTNVDLEAEAALLNKPMIATTVAPTASPAPQTANSVTVYYNPSGGKYYHASATCEAVDQKWWPLTGFSYDVLNSPQYSKLLPCSKCNPPPRVIGN